MMKLRTAVLIAALSAWAAGAHAQDDEAATGEAATEEAAASALVVSVADGLAAWDRVYAVTSHPRCTNCHVDARGVPMWSGPSYGAARPHGMNITAGASRIGAEHLACGTCHATSRRPNATPHAPPHAGHAWMLPPARFAWAGKDSAAVCAQLRDPARNGGRDGAALVDHVRHDAERHAFITWAFDPGPGREPAPGTLAEHLDAVIAWTGAGMPCPNDPEPAEPEPTELEPIETETP